MVVNLRTTRTTTKPIDVMGEDLGVVEEVLGRSLEQQDGLEYQH